MAHRRRRDANRPVAEDINQLIVNRPITRYYAQSINNLNESLSAHLPSTNEQYSWSTPQTNVTVVVTVHDNAQTSSRSSKSQIKTTSTVTRATKTRVKASVARSAKIKTATTSTATSSSSVRIDTSSVSQLTEDDAASTVNQSNFLKSTITVSTINQTTSSASETNFDGITSTVSIQTESATTSLSSNSWLTWPTTSIIPPTSPLVTSSDSGSSIIDSELNLEVNRTTPATTETLLMAQSSSSSFSPITPLDTEYYNSSDSTEDIIQPFARMWQPFPCVNQTTTATVHTTSTVTRTTTHPLTFTTYTDHTQSTSFATSSLTSLNEYLFPSPHETHPKPQTHQPAANPISLAPTGFAPEYILKEIECRRVAWTTSMKAIDNPDSSDNSDSYLIFTALRNHDPTVSPIVKKCKYRCKTSSECSKHDSLHVYEYTEDSISYGNKSPQPYEGVKARKNRLLAEKALKSERPFQTVGQSDSVLQSVVQEEPVYQSVGQKDPVYKSVGQEDPVYQTVSQEGPVYLDVGQAVPVFQTVGQTDSVSQSVCQADPLFQSVGQVDPVFQSVGQENPVFQSLCQADPVFQSVGQADPVVGSPIVSVESPIEPEPGPSGICGVRRHREDSEEEPAPKIVKIEDDSEGTNINEILRLNQDDQLKIAELDANGIDYTLILEEAYRNKDAYFENID
ncbi:uncharacterized protein YMR317W-like isoform X2 [Colias croceus]|uniref:uncharacterized protein YMR317W-like isoform X2 n=1 Tax=Colias crocea TaxID=72248 RepID=UPI001E27E62C|nr:uncharacterized protein YMR317W-like isoform X2 [Colias croceus]